MGNTKYKIISAFASVGVYFLFLVLFLVYLQTTNVKKIDANSKVTVLQLDIVLDDVKKVKQKIEIKSASQNTKIAKDVVKKSKSVSVKQRTNLKSLFANVKVSAKTVTKQKVLNVKQSSIASRFKSKFEKEKKTKKLVLSDLLETKKHNTATKTLTMEKSKNDTDPYYSKIYTMLSTRWNPTIFVNDLKAKVLVTISNNGKFSYKFIQYSDNIGFDNQLREFLDEQTTKLYPISPTNSTVTVEIVFQSKG